MTQIKGGIGNERFTIEGTLGRIKAIEKKIETCCSRKVPIRERYCFAMTRE